MTLAWDRFEQGLCRLTAAHALSVRRLLWGRRAEQPRSVQVLDAVAFMAADELRAWPELTDVTWHVLIDSLFDVLPDMVGQLTDTPADQPAAPLMLSLLDGRYVIMPGWQQALDLQQGVSIKLNTSPTVVKTLYLNALYHRFLEMLGAQHANTDSDAADTSGVD